VHIEVKTTVRKLTKSLVNQMFIASLAEMLEVLESPSACILGFLINARKGYYKVILIKTEVDFFIVPVREWEKLDSDSDCDYDMRFSIISGEAYIKFDSEQARDAWFNAYAEIVPVGLKTHLYV
jgi:hypothetical protein